MKRILRFIYWLAMSVLFVLLLVREHRISQLRHIEV